MIILKDFQGYKAPKLGTRAHSLVNGEKTPPLGFGVFFPPFTIWKESPATKAKILKGKENFWTKEPHSSIPLKMSVVTKKELWALPLSGATERHSFSINNHMQWSEIIGYSDFFFLN